MKGRLFYAVTISGLGGRKVPSPSSAAGGRRRPLLEEEAAAAASDQAVL